MILELIFDLILELLKYFLGMLDFMTLSLPDWIPNSINLILKGLSFFPFEIWSVIVANGTFWLVVQFSWSVAEWVYKKIPGVN